MKAFVTVMSMALLASGVTGPAAHAAERYETLAAAEALDEKCGFLPYLEHYVLQDLVFDAVSNSSLASTALKMGDDNAVPNFYKTQAAKAATTPCTTDTANAVVVPVRGDILMELAIAVSTAGVRQQRATAPTDWTQGFTLNTYTAPSQDQIAAAKLLEGYVGGLWGDRGPTLAPYAMQTAQQRVAADKDDNDTRWSRYLYMVDYQARAEADAKTLSSGPGRWQRLRDPLGGALSQRAASFGKTGMAFVYLIVRNGEVFASAHQGGAGAISGQTGLRVYVRKPEAPTRKDNLPLSWDASWRSQAHSFDLKAVDETAFGGVVYRVPPEAIAAIQALKDDDTVEVAIVEGDYDHADNNGSSRTTFDIGSIKSALKPQ